MVYNIEISVNLLKETKFLKIEKTINYIARSYSCDNMYLLTEEDGTTKIPRYHCIYVIIFVDENFDNLIKFIKCIKKNKSIYIECVYENDIYKLLYASSLYLKSLDKELSKKYTEFIKDNKFTPNETILLRELI
jgi:hypothetical protein